MFKGEKNSGKTTLAASIIKQFLNTQDKEAKVIYVGLSSKGKELKQTFSSDNLMTIGVDDDSQASFCMAPHLAIKVAAELSNCLLVFDDVLLQHMKER